MPAQRFERAFPLEPGFGYLRVASFDKASARSRKVNGEEKVPSIAEACPFKLAIVVGGKRPNDSEFLSDGLQCPARALIGGGPHLARDSGNPSSRFSR